MAILTSIIDEDVLGHIPLNYDLAHICGTMKVESPPKMKLIAGFKSLNYEACQTFYNSSLWKTDAPPEVIYDLFRAWVS